MNKIAEEITITVISTDHEEMAYETISRGVMARLLTVWTVLSKNLTRVICSPGYIRHLTLYMPESIEDMCPERYLDCLLLPARPFEWIDYSVLERCTVLDLLRMADHLKGFKTEEIALHSSIDHQRLIALLRVMLSQYTPGDLGYRCVVSFLATYHQDLWYVRTRVRELRHTSPWRSVPYRDLCIMLQDLLE